MSDQNLFYLQDSRSYVGNDILWWGKKGCGYTTDLSKAEVYTKEDAVGQHQCRESDRPWPKDYIDQRIRPAVDMQYTNIDEALKGTGVSLIKPRKPKKETYKCDSCGRFVTEVDFYEKVYHGHPCSKCEDT